MCSSKSVFFISFSAASLVNPVQCQYFLNTFPLFRCVVVAGRFFQFPFLCPNGTVFSEELATCNWSWMVDCPPSGVFSSSDCSHEKYSYFK